MGIYQIFITFLLPPTQHVSGLEPSEVRYAQEEFKKFDMDGSGKE